MYSKRFTLPMSLIERLAEEDNESECVRNALIMWFEAHPHSGDDDDGTGDSPEED